MPAYHCKNCGSTMMRQGNTYYCYTCGRRVEEPKSARILDEVHNIGQQVRTVLTPEKKRRGLFKI